MHTQTYPLTFEVDPGPVRARGWIRGRGNSEIGKSLAGLELVVIASILAATVTNTGIDTMAKTAVSDALKSLTATGEKRPKLVFLGHGSMTGRAPSLLKIRPSLWAKLENLGVVGGGNYMLVELGLQLLIAQLEAQPEGEITVIRAETLAVTDEDIQLLKAAGKEQVKAPRKRVAKTSWTDPEKNEL